MLRPFARLRIGLALALAAAAAAAPAHAQHPDSAALLAAQTEALRTFAMIDGVWRGPATTVLADGSRLTFIQTERIGPFLGGSIRVIEGRGYADDGAVRFNAFGIVSYDVARRVYSLHSHAQGHASATSPSSPTGDGYRLGDPCSGRGATIRYVATHPQRRAARGRRPDRLRPRAAAHLRHAPEAPRRHRLAGGRRGAAALAAQEQRGTGRPVPLIDFCVGPKACS